MAKAKKLPSGNWRVQIFIGKNENGKNVYKSFTAETKAEAELKANEYLVAYRTDKKIDEKRNRLEATVEHAIDKYIEKCELLSPTSVATYHKIKRNNFKELQKMKIGELDHDTMQKFINEEAKKKTRLGSQIAPKTVNSAYCFISTAIYDYAGVRFATRLPKIPKKNITLPKPKQIFDLFVGTEIELPVLLAMWLSFSMSEIRGLKCSSVKGNIISINQVIVDVDGEHIEKSIAKAENRIRQHILPGYLLNLITNTEVYQHYLETGEDDFLIKMTASMITKRYRKIMPEDMYVSFHKLRHINASVMLALNIPEKYAMERGGWKTPYTMKEVYQHTFSDERQQIDRRIDDYFENLIKDKEKSKA